MVISKFKFFIYYYFLFNNYRHTNNNKTEENQSFYKINYKINNNNLSGYKGFLPKTINKTSFLEIGNVLNNIFYNKGIELENLEIIKKDDNSLLIIITLPKKVLINQIKLDSSLQFLFDQLEKQNENKNPLKGDILKNPLGISSYKQKGIIEVLKLFNEKAGKIYNIILSKTQNKILYVQNYHKDIPQKTINNLKFFFVKVDKNSIEYTTKIPENLEINKLKNALIIEENNFLYNIINLFMYFPPIQLNQRDGQNLNNYIMTQGYNNSQLLDIKYIENNNGYTCYVYILIGEKLNIHNVTFSIENHGYNKLLEQLANENFITEENILDKNYIPNKIYNIIKKNINIPFEIIKTVNEISVPKKAYNINFHIEFSSDNYYIENIYFINNSEENLFQNINSKIGYKFNKKTIEKDKKILIEQLGEKIEYNIYDGYNKQGKIIIFTIGEPFDINQILNQLKPNFSFNFREFLNIKKNINFNLPINEKNLPMSLNLDFHWESLIKAFILISKIQINLNKFILNLLNKKDKEKSYFNLTAGITYIFNSIYNFKNNFDKKFIGFNLGNNNFKDWKDYHQWYYKNHLEILYFFQNQKTKLQKKTTTFFKNGWNYKYQLSFGKEHFSKFNDNLDITFGLQDQITFDNYFFFKPYFNLAINYVYYNYQNIIFQNNLQCSWTAKDNEILYLEKELNIIGKKNNYLDDRKFNIIFLNLFIISKQIQEIHFFIGQKVEILIGYFINSFYGINNNFQDDFKNIDYKIYHGFIITFKMTFGILNIYIPIPWLNQEKIYFFKNENQKLIDFSLESSSKERKNQKELFIYKPKIIFNDNITE